MNALAAFEAILLAGIAAIHVAWGLGVRWPRNDEKALVALVVGYDRDRMPSPSRCFLAAGAIFAAAMVMALLSGLIDTLLAPWFVVLLGSGMTAVFAGRGIAGYLPAWRKRFPRQPFAQLDRGIYSPLCLIIAATCAILVFHQMRS
jgi:hypothetical protein